MKKFLSVFFLSIVAISTITYFSISYNPYITNETGIKKPNEWFFMQRAFPVGEINYEVYLKSLKSSQVFRNEQHVKKDSSLWEFAGPLNIGGRLTDVEMHPSDMQTIYAAAASGGIFKTVNAGESWSPIFDDALNLSVGDIAIAPSNSQIIYAGTGEANCGGGSQTYDGVGIYKSSDGGDTWTHCGLEASRNIGRLVIHPENPDVVYVAAMGNLFSENPERGIYKTSDGGISWLQVLYVSDSTGGIDIVIHPEDPDTLYSAMWERVRRPNRRSYGGLTCGIYRTYDGGQNWTELTNGLPSPGPNVGRIGIDISQSDPNTLYAIYADKPGYFEGVYKSINCGDSWSQTNDGSLSDCYASYGWWFGRISIDPVDPNVAFVIGFDLYKTSNGGNSWSNISSPEVHVDHHGLYIHPMNHNFIVNGNDGGLYTSLNGGSTWSWVNNLPVTQFYTCEVDHQHPERLYGGTQDNETNRTTTGNIDDWQSIYWGDGFYVLVDPLNNNYVYAEYQYGNFAKSTNGGNSFNTAMNGISGSDRMNWCTPVVFDPANPEILYYGANRLYKSTNRASSWSAISTDLTNGPGVNLTYGTISTISVSPVNPEIIYVGTDDGNVWVSATNGMGWEYLSASLPDRWVTRVAADPVDENTAYVAFSGYRWDEYLPHIFRTSDMGQTWEDISGNLPEAPINDVIIDPEDNNCLYAATDVGVFVTQNLGQTWEMEGLNLPNVPINDLTLHNESRTLVAATFGRSMYKYDLNQDTLTTSVFENIDSSEPFSINAFPNPFHNQLSIIVKSSAEFKSKVEICDLSGRILLNLFEGTFTSGVNTISAESADVNKLNPGIYFIKVDFGDRVVSKKILRQKN
jgi:photosystem II stability/assembly factor-like uncharacterized protein